LWSLWIDMIVIIIMIVTVVDQLVNKHLLAVFFGL
jgi:hypothetical protein